MVRRNTHIEAQRPCASGKGPTTAVPRVPGAAALVWVLVSLLLNVSRAWLAHAENFSAPFIAEVDTSGFSHVPTIDDGGFATTNFTPPWNATQALTIFATSSTQGGNLGGLEGARTLCQSLATAVPALAGTTWYPLLSDSTYDASTLTGKSSASAPIYNIDGSVIAVNRASLWSGGTLTTGVKGTETGVTRYDTVFTGTSATGDRTGSLCSNWTSTSGNGTIGATNERSSTWIAGYLTSCAVPYRLYCIGNYDPTQPATTPTPTPTNTQTPTPTPTSTWTPTPSVTAIPPTNSPTPSPINILTPTPSVALVSFQILIGGTPVPSLPIKIGAETMNTDLQGFASTTVASSSLITIQTGLSAVSFTPTTGTAGRFHSETTIIEASRLITPSTEICSVSVGGVPHLFFPYSSTSDTTLSVPLSLHRLNRILSPSGQAAPVALFPPGDSENGFILPSSHFESGGTLNGTWEFLATRVSVPASPLPCAERGAPATPPHNPLPGCSSFDLSVLLRETQKSITYFSQESLKAAARREWKPKGSVREPFLRGGAISLNKMLSTIKQAGTNLYSCATPPSTSGCAIKTLNKVSIKKDFSLIFPKNLPAGLARVKRRIPGEVARFHRMVDALPSTLYSCP